MNHETFEVATVRASPVVPSPRSDVLQPRINRAPSSPIVETSG
jgi:hypothetical protein